MNLMTEGHWMVVQKRWWPLYLPAGPAGFVPIAETRTGALVAVIAFRRSAPYTLATARAAVNQHNAAVNAARRKAKHDPKKD